MADCSYITLAHIRVQGYPANGINIDDGGTFETPSHNIVLDNVAILDVGPAGNHDALKMSGVDDFVVKNCHFEGWGGSGIDMVGCHRGKITDCTFVGKKNYSQSNGIQLKGGTSNVIVEACLFRNAGHRSINLALWQNSYLSVCFENWCYDTRHGYGLGRFIIQSGHCGGRSAILYVWCHFRSHRPFSLTL